MKYRTTNRTLSFTFHHDGDYSWPNRMMKQADGMMKGEVPPLAIKVGKDTVLPCVLISYGPETMEDFDSKCVNITLQVIELIE